MYFRQVLNDATACASYVLGCKTRSQFAVVDPHADMVDEYLRLGQPDVLVHEVGVRVDHSELRLRLAAEQVRGARGLVVEELAEVHASEGTAG